MYMHYRPAAAIFRLTTGGLAVAGTALQFVTFGSAAWRLFSTWTLLITALYFVVIAIVSAFWSRRSLGKQNSPVLEGTIIVANMMTLVGAVYFWQIDQSSWWSDNIGMTALYLLVPIMALLDYCLFCRKGRFHVIFPIDWLAFPTIYAALILLTALNRFSTLELAIPYEFLNYELIGFNNFALSLVIIVILTLAFGYLLFLIDFALSGKLAKQIVLPRLKAVVVEETPDTHMPETAVAAIVPAVDPTPSTSLSETPKPSLESDQSLQPAKTDHAKTTKTTKPKSVTQQPKTKKATANNSKRKKSAKTPSSQNEQQVAVKGSSAKGRAPVKNSKTSGRKSKGNLKDSRPQLGVKNRPEVQAVSPAATVVTPSSKPSDSDSKQALADTASTSQNRPKTQPVSSSASQKASKTTPKIRKF